MSVTPKNGEGGEREKEREEKERRRGKEESMIRNENDRRLQGEQGPTNRNSEK